MKPIFTSRSIGKNLTEYKRFNFEVLAHNLKKFVVYSQFDPNRLVGKYVATPTCGAAEILYGIDDAGEEHEMMRIIDSSD